MLDWGIKLAIVGFVAWVIWKTLQPRAVFVIELRDGVARTTSGKITAAVLEEIGSLCREQGIQRGRVRGVMRTGGGIALHFSRGFPAGLQQQIRNAYEASR